jgi:hypothetical protein
MDVWICVLLGFPYRQWAPWTTGKVWGVLLYLDMFGGRLCWAVHFSPRQIRAGNSMW